MKTFKLTIPLVIILILTGCFGGEKPNYTITDDDLDANYKIVEMQTYDPESEFFTFRFDERIWELETWDVDEAPNRVVLMNKGYEDGSCYVLPGTIGQGQQDGTLVLEGTLLTENYTAKTLEITTTAGIRLMYVVGYEVGGLPYIFEIDLPLKDPLACELDAQELVASFVVDVPKKEGEESEVGEGEIEEEEVVVEKEGEESEVGESEGSEDTDKETSTESDGDN